MNYKSLLKGVLIFTFASKAISTYAQTDSVSGVNNIDTIAYDVNKLKDEVEVLKRLKVTGWLQAQYQHADTVGVFNFAGGNVNNPATGLPNAIENRFFIRRGRIKFTYDNDFSQYVIQLDATERSVTVRDFYGKFTEKKLNAFTLTAGLQNRPFGYEIQQSSSVRETPERARFTQVLLPNERDLGVMLTFQMPKTARFHAFKLDAGLFNGTNIVAEIDNKKDFIGRLSFNKATVNEKISFGAGLSYYNGGIRQPNKYVYTNVATDATTGIYGFAMDSTSFKGHFARREYMGGDFQLALDLPIGITQLRAEYIQGYQPGTASTSISAQVDPNTSKTPDYDKKLATYVRPCNGAYFYFVQNIGQSPISMVLKYDWYDPNTKVKGDQIGVKGSNTNATDVRYDTYGFGLNYRWNTHVKIMAYYDLVKNETTKNIGGANYYNRDKPDNIFTLRFQYRF